MENVLAVIPEPEFKNRKYFVQIDLWDYAVQKCSTSTVTIMSILLCFLQIVSVFKHFEK